MYLVYRTIGLSDYWIVGLSGCRIIGMILKTQPILILMEN